RFEGWFSTSKEFKRQKSSKEIICPICGDTNIDKALMAPNVSTVVESKSVNKNNQDIQVNNKATIAEFQKSSEFKTALKQLKEAVEKNCDYVGNDFAEEARKITYGESKERSIYGETSSEEARELHDEGIEFNVLPWGNRSDA
ncbi:DUF1178 family protein, partial [Alphaproteobacteria bacterium]|nr:DUF1178 family protein [Alphaproteobacteria bacterium]